MENVVIVTELFRVVDCDVLNNLFWAQIELLTKLCVVVPDLLVLSDSHNCLRDWNMYFALRLCIVNESR